jgi:hypothetical protein
MLRSLYISDWQSEPHHQHQNACERRIQDLKRMTNTVLDRTNAPPNLWLHCLQYVCFICNHTASSSLDDAVPLQVLTGSTPDISHLLFFKFYEPVYYKLDDSDLPSDTREERGRWIGISEHVGHAMTFLILTDDTKHVIHRSNIRTACDPSTANLRLDPLNDKPLSNSIPPVLRSRLDKLNLEILTDHGEMVSAKVPHIDINDLVGRTFLMPQEEDGQQHRARIIQAIDEHEK